MRYCFVLVLHMSKGAGRAEKPPPPTSSRGATYYISWEGLNWEMAVCLGPSSVKCLLLEISGSPRSVSFLPFALKVSECLRIDWAANQEGPSTNQSSTFAVLFLINQQHSVDAVAVVGLYEGVIATDIIIEVKHIKVCNLNYYAWHIHSQ